MLSMLDLSNKQDSMQKPKNVKHVYFFQENKGSKQELFIVVYINQLFKGAPLSLL